jgi:hypothetical protein
MEVLESENFENHVQKNHFENAEKYIRSEKNSSPVLELSPILSILKRPKITKCINSFCRITKNFRENIFVQKRLDSSNKSGHKSLHNLPSNKKRIKIVINRGTSYCVIGVPLENGFFYPSSPSENLPETRSVVKLVCNTCKMEMDSEICRILITQNIDKCPQFFSFHFFSPCWSFEDFCKKYPNRSLDRMAVSIPENVSISENGIKDLQNNLSFWT